MTASTARRITTKPDITGSLVKHLVSVIGALYVG